MEAEFLSPQGLSKTTLRTDAFRKQEAWDYASAIICTATTKFFCCLNQIFYIFTFKQIIMNKKNFIRSLTVVVGVFAAHFFMDVYKMGIKDGKAHANHTAINK
jgi:hypothetical protein